MPAVIRLRRVLAPVLGVSLALGLLVLPGPATRAAVACTDSSDGAEQVSLTVDKQKASGWVALPAGKPKGIVAVTHGYGHTGLSWVHHLRWAARELGVIALAMDYRGAKVSPPKKDGDLPSARGWNVSAGAADTIAATRLYEACAPDAMNVLFSISMGSNTGGLVLAEGPQRSNGRGPLYDYWFNLEGAVNVIETYLSARMLAVSGNATAVNALEDITAEMGGSIEEVPEEYQKRAVVTRVDEIAASGVKGVMMIHGLDDGLVPYNQSRELLAGFDATGVPAQMFTVGRRTAESEKDTSLTNYVMSNYDKNYISPVAGHASEKSFVHIVMKTAFERLVAAYRGEVPECRTEHFIDASSPPVPPPGPC
jgi:hypothetical protein